MLSIGVLLVILNLASTIGEYVLSEAVAVEAARSVAHLPGNKETLTKAFIGGFYGDFYLWVNVVTVFLQAFVVSRLVNLGGIRAAVLALPILVLGVYAMIAAGVGFMIIRWIKVVESASDYSVMNTARALLWLPTSRAEKYRAKQTIDTFFVRMGDMLAAVLVLAGSHVFAMSIRSFALLNVALALVCIAVCVPIVRHYQKHRAPSAPRPRAQPARALDTKPLGLPEPY